MRASAASLLLDFGPTVAPAGDTTNSPGHTSGGVLGTDTTWNTVGASDIASGLVYGDGTAATGVSLNLGRESTIGNRVLDFTIANNLATTLTGTTGPSLGTDYGTASNFPPARDGLFVSGTNGTNNAALGVRVDGLSAGTYTLYFVGRNTNTNANPFPEAFYIAAGASSGTFDFSALSEIDLSNANTTGNNSFILGNQYNTATVTLTAGQSIFLAVAGPTGGTEQRGFLNSLEIVQSVPEPSVFSLAAGGFLLALVRRRRPASGR